MTVELKIKEAREKEKYNIYVNKNNTNESLKKFPTFSRLSFE